jgi:hypothetical protein
MTFSGHPELLAAVAHLSDDSVRAAMSSHGRSYADAHYGDPQGFVDGVSRTLGDQSRASTISDGAAFTPR